MNLNAVQTLSNLAPLACLPVQVTLWVNFSDRVDLSHLSVDGVESFHRLCGHVYA